MATRREYFCKTCRMLVWAGSFFNALKNAAENHVPACPECGGDRTLRLTFELGEGVGPRSWDVVHAFFPSKKLPYESVHWPKEDGTPVTFYPFLVVLGKPDHEEETSVWLPYWHLEQNGDKTRYKYGQWAPLMEMAIFEDLLRQARDAGVRLNGLL